jgi:hypothetical protein
MKKFTIFWLTGERDVFEGDTPAHAMMLAGYGSGSTKAIDFYAEGDNNDYIWNKGERCWDSIKKTV